MHIELERKGGFAGLTLRKSIDSGTLSPDDAQALERLIDDSRFFSLPAVMAHAGPGADRFHYRITAEDCGKRHTVEVDEAAASPELRLLIRWIEGR